MVAPFRSRGGLPARRLVCNDWLNVIPWPVDVKIEAVREAEALGSRLRWSRTQPLSRPPRWALARRMPRRRSLTLAVVLAVLAIGVGVALSYAIHWFPAQASTQARNTDRLYHVLVIACIPIF